MPKVKLNPTFDEFRGSVNNLTYRLAYGRTFASVKVDRSDVQLSEAQIAHHQRFKKAIAYGKIVMADPIAYALYQQAAKERNKPLFALTVADFMHTPSITDMDLSAYNGRVNDVIKIQAEDDFSVASVHVTINNLQTGVPIESGSAIETAPGSGLWLYTATSATPAEIEVQINVVATDRPGGTAVDSRIKAL
jgi:hypothetical protein